MQDLEEYQIEIIDEIFEKGTSKTIVQRIGDPNQSIYNKVKDECDWKPRNSKFLNGSLTFTKPASFKTFVKNLEYNKCKMACSIPPIY